jgi:hypothetical protein
MSELNEQMARAAWDMLLEMRATDPVGYREFFANLIPLDALPSEVYSDRQLEVIHGAVVRGFARRADGWQPRSLGSKQPRYLLAWRPVVTTCKGSARRAPLGPYPISGKDWPYRDGLRQQ